MFDIKTSREKLQQLAADHRNLIAEPLNISLAEKCCQDAWHLADWDFTDKQKLNPNLTKEQYRINLYHQCPEMAILHDLSNSMKHKILDRPKAKIQKTDIHHGSFDSSFSKSFDISCLQVILEDGTQFDVDDLVKTSIDYWNVNLI